MTTVQLTTNLQGLKRNWWHRDLYGFFTIDGKALSDSQVRKLVNWGIAHGCRTEADIPGDKISEILQEHTEHQNDKQQLKMEL